MKLEITPTDVGYRLEGELDMATADDLSEILPDRGTRRPRRPRLRGDSFMDSSGLRVLLRRPRRTRGPAW